MKKFREQNLKVVAAIATAVAVVGVLLALNLSKLPLINNNKTYKANFANSGGLAGGDIVTIAGVQVGKIKSLALKGTYVQVTFQMSGGTHVGKDTSVAAKVLTPIGQEYLAVSPAGPGQLATSDVIPLSRTQTPLTLVSDLNDLTAETQQINIDQLEKSLNVTTQLLQGTTPQAINVAFSGLAQLSQLLASHTQQLSQLVTGAEQVTGVLNTHSGALIDLVNQSDLVLQVLNNRRQAIQTLLSTTSTLGTELNNLFSGNQGELQHLINNLQTVSGVLAHDSTDIGNALPLLAAFSKYGANVSGSGPYLDANAPTLLIPDNVAVACQKQQPIPAVQGCRV